MAAKSKNIGKASITLSLDDRVSAGLKKMQAKFSRVGQSLTRIGGGAVAAGVAIASAFAYPIKAASDLEETMNKFNVVFGENAGVVKAWGDEFAGQVGRSKRQVADFLGSSQDLFVPLGFEPGAATELSKQITTLAIDLASFNNLKDEQPFGDLTAALTGSGEVMKKYAVIVNEAAVKQELLNQKIDLKKVTNAQKVQARLNIIMRDTTTAQGDAIRSADGFANRVKALTGLLEDTAAVLGNAILPEVTRLVGFLIEGVDVIGKFTVANTNLVRMIAQVGVGLLLAGGLITALGVAVSLAGAAVGGMVTIVTTLVAVFGALIAPMGAVLATLSGLAVWFAVGTETGRQMVDTLATKFTELLDIAQTTFYGMADALAAGDIELAADVMWAGLRLAWLTGTAGIRDIWDSTMSGFVNLWIDSVGNIERVWSHTTQFLGDAFDTFTTAAKLAINSVWGFFQKVWAAMVHDASASELARIQKGIDDTAAQIGGDNLTSRTKRRRAAEAFRAQSKVTQFAGNEAVGRELFNKQQEAIVDLHVAKKAFEGKRRVARSASAAAASEVSAAELVKGALAGVGEIGVVSAKATNPGAILDASFAGRQFGTGGDKQVELLAEIRDELKKDKGAGIPVK